jgi:SAM-dependent methyltransferase
LSQHVPSAWYADFFTELPNEFWRQAVPPQATASEVDFIEERLGLAPGSRLVDVPCGSGRHTLALAARGHAVTGLDISVEAIDYARRAAEAAGLDVVFHHADMREVPPDGFDAAICMGNSFGYLDLAGTRAFVAALAAAVRPGGGLVVDYNAAAESVLPGYTGEDRTMQAGDITVAATTAYDVARSCLVSGYRFSRGAEEVAVTALHHVLTCAQIGDLLTEVGFVDVEHYAGPDGEPFRLGAPRLLVTARRAR